MLVRKHRRPWSPASRNSVRSCPRSRQYYHQANRITPRVLTNRLWQHHFAKGLCESPSDFGRLGQPPSHPELLDWLAKDFVEQGWNWKYLHRQMVTSAAYRQQSYGPEIENA